MVSDSYLQHKLLYNNSIISNFLWPMQVSQLYCWKQDMLKFRAVLCGFESTPDAFFWTSRWWLTRSGLRSSNTFASNYGEIEVDPSIHIRATASDSKNITLREIIDAKSYVTHSTSSPDGITFSRYPLSNMEGPNIFSLEIRVKNPLGYGLGRHCGSALWSDATTKNDHTRRFGFHFAVDVAIFKFQAAQIYP